ncbi:hypothetical protein PRK78_002161 [Emydomyces testavorans]|uniref:Uncharacterized protein n=1 Tax=Emydomyces testavorans TaxID=2070801 RepID=A0AAF0IHC9_9EURO|nr:hypothetical protein PRK78_002161 [Emydomyces testavorans]
MNRSDISVVAVELSGHRPAKAMLLRGENVGSPKISPMQPRPVKQFRMAEQWDNAINGAHGVPPMRMHSRGPERNHSRRRSQLPPPSPSPPFESDVSSESRGEEQRTQGSEASAPDDKPKSESAEHPSETPPLPIVQVDVVPPLTKVHFSCYQSHRSFMVSKNAYHSVPCMTCLKADQQVRWRCTFCSLRVCGDCAKGIANCKERSLMEFLENLVQNLEGSGAE